MAVKAGVSDALFTYTNATHYSGYAFPDVNSGTGFTSGFWVYLNNTTPFTAWAYDGSSSFLRIRHDGTNWLFDLNGATTIINTIAVGAWVNFAYIKNGNNHRIYQGLSQKINTTVAITFTFSLFTLTIGAGNAICAFKMLNVANTDVALINGGWVLFSSDVSGVIWQSPLRRAGDLLANHAVYGGSLFTSINEWTSTPDWTTLEFQDDPASLKPTYCYAILLPVGGITSVHLEATSEMVASLATLEKEDGYFMVEDRQAVPTDAAQVTIYYRGLQYNTGVVPGTTIISIDRWALYIDEHGTRIDRTLGSADALGTEGAVPYNWLGNPNGGNLDLSQENVYDWQFGVHWYFVHGIGPGAPSQPSAHSHVTYPLVLFQYIGSVFPVDGPPIEPPVDPPPTEIGPPMVCPPPAPERVI